ncbi:MAG: hypothetical protein KGJ07_03305 [Patescibacteria group bacterium]|nr:hypothetical protein [Patescibacteria group bacterium]
MQILFWLIEGGDNMHEHVSQSIRARSLPYGIREFYFPNQETWAYITSEARTAFGSTAHFAKTALRRGREIIEQLRVDPYGQQSIDPQKDNPRLKHDRTVISVTVESHNHQLIPVAIKGPGMLLQPDSTYTPVSFDSSEGMRREPLVLQMMHMQALRTAFKEVLNEDQRAIVDILPVYGACSMQEPENNIFDALLMQAIPHAQLASEHEIGPNRFGSKYGFLKSEHPRLLDAFPELQQVPEDIIPWGNLMEIINARLTPYGLTLTTANFSGRSLLIDENGKYWLFDLRSDST